MNAVIEDLETVLVAAGRLVASGKPGALVRLYRPALNNYVILRLRMGDTPAEIIARVRALYAEAACSARGGNSPLTVSIRTANDAVVILSGVEVTAALTTIHQVV